MTSKPVRVRFAPSPTGFLHIGGVRTALYNYLYAQHHRGKFLLRIEDTDTERSETRYTDDILASLKWLGLKWEEDLIYQSKRLDYYSNRVNEMIEKGYAYRCYSTEKEIEAMREKAVKEGRRPMYDRTWRDSKETPPAGAPFVVRVKIPLDGEITFQDLIHGPIVFKNEDIDDFVIVRSNGMPTYNLTVVLDDIEMGITHVIRGDDHINNTPKQAHLYRYLGAPVPEFAHLSMIMGPDKKKMSKRHGDVSANAYRAEGYLPEALLNFLVRLGWSHGDQEVFSMDEMIQAFDFGAVQKSAAVFNLEKLQWVNGVHIRQASPKRLAAILREDFGAMFDTASIDVLNTETGLKLIDLLRPKAKTMKEIAEQLAGLIKPGVLEVTEAELKWIKQPALKAPSVQGVASLISDFETRLENKTITDATTFGDLGFTHVEIEAIIKEHATRSEVKLGDFVQPLRLVITGRVSGMGLFELLPWLPIRQTLNRMKKVASL